jgi:hypothetical protein
MAKKDKILDIIALTPLSEDARIARLASQKVGQNFTMAHAVAVIRCYFPPGNTQALAQKLFEEKHRQERLANDRRAVKNAAANRLRSPIDRFRPEVVGARRAEANRKARRLEIAQRIFGQHVRENFNEDALALMSLISGEDRSYRVDWLDAGHNPVSCALIEVTTRCKPNTCQTNTIRTRFLLYKAGGRVLVARVARNTRTTQDGFGAQLPERFVEAAPRLLEEGFTLRSDLEAQEMIVIAPNGDEAHRVPWIGRTVDE